MKNKGFRKDFALSRAAMLKKNGATPSAVASFLCQKGFARASARKFADEL